MGKRRDALRARAHRLVRASTAPAEAASHVAFRSPGWQLPFFYAVDTGESTWVLPPGASSRPATAQEQAVLNAREANEPAEEVVATDWRAREYGVLPGPYLYSASLGSVRALPPAPTWGYLS